MVGTLRVDQEEEDVGAGRCGRQRGGKQRGDGRREMARSTSGDVNSGFKAIAASGSLLACFKKFWGFLIRRRNSFRFPGGTKGTTSLCSGW
jgi:hypothetical protein